MASVSLSRILQTWADRTPDKIAVCFDDERLTFAELDSRSNRLARAYQSLGVKADDLVTLALPNGSEYFVSCFAIWKCGATPQPVSARLPQHELLQIIELAEPALVVGLDSPLESVATLPVGYEADSALSDDQLPEATATSFKAMTSGGSTGRPKLIISAVRAVFDPDGGFLNYGVGGSVLVPGPLYHNGPFLWAMNGLFLGNQVTVTKRFDASQTLALIEREKVDTLYLVPTMMQRIWNLAETERQAFDLSSLRALWHLAAPCPPWLKEAFIDWLGADVICELYGGTEGQGSTVISGTEWLAHRGSVGRPGDHCEMKVVDDSGNTLPAGEIGELYMRPKTGPGSTYRYIGADARRIEGGWESLGDMGYFDADGYLYLTDRRTDMVLSGGRNIYPAEIEAAIDSFAGVRSSAVIGMPDDELGNTVHAIIDHAGAPLSESALMEHLRERLTSYKLPRSIEWVDEPLRDDAGKVRRRALRDARVQ
ncbi:MAG: AMP-binding protein [Pseudomonadaceae bacterium]|nr:AMP-binding protein [Pseudomonadaceae bacterium]